MASGILASAVEELVGGLTSILGREPSVTGEAPAGGPYILLGVKGQSEEADRLLSEPEASALGDEGYVIRTIADPDGEGTCTVLAGVTERGVLYAVFHFLRLLAAVLPPCPVHPRAAFR